MKFTIQQPVNVPVEKVGQGTIPGVNGQLLATLEINDCPSDNGQHDQLLLLIIKRQSLWEGTEFGEYQGWCQTTTTSELLDWLTELQPATVVNTLFLHINWPKYWTIRKQLREEVHQLLGRLREDLRQHQKAHHTKATLVA